jgi:light-regulated signal transduction histidine kinase (bacteriophytochrome)
MTQVKAASAIDISECDREPIHIPGSIQQHGVLLACSTTSWDITHVSSNAAELLKRPARQLLGCDLVELLGAPQVERLEEALGRATPLVASPARVLGLKLKGGRRSFNVSIHSHDGRRIVEIEPTGDEPTVPPLELVKGILARLQQSHSIFELCDDTAHQLRDLIGFDRVMVYRFLHDGSGQVIAEASSDDLEPLLNLRFPASDIPKQARELYKRSWIRLISDVQGLPSPILATVKEGKRPLDLSFADLRSVSPIHIEYLRNMRVGASMSISIIVGGELWGLIACHHRGSRVVPANVRAAAELIGQVFSLQVQTVEGIEAYVTMRAARALLDRVVAEFPADGDLVDNLAQRLDQIAAFVPCDGAGVWIDGAWRTWRSTPTAAEVKVLVQTAEALQSRTIVATHDLPAVHSPALAWPCKARGLLAVPLSHTSSDWLLFFRREAAQVVEWAGDPTKPLLSGGTGGRLSPRASFAAWKEEVRGQSLPWSSRERLIGETLRVYLLDIIVRFSEVILEERRQAEQRQRLLTSELNHRVKGTLELIQSLMLHGYDGDAGVRDFVRRLEGRIKAIALAHDAISVSSSSEIRNLFEAAIAPHVPPGRPVHISGPAIRLDAKAYTVLALVVHELVTNAEAYGSLSVPDGKLTIRWQIDAAGRLMVLWEEEGGPPPEAQVKDGLGMLIIRRNIPHALDGEAAIELGEQGTRAAFTIPARFVATPPKLRPPNTRPQLTAPRLPLDGCSVLVLEDQVTMALELERLLIEHGAVSVTAVGTATSAIEALASDPPDIAILDIDLGDGTSMVVADELAKLAIPFVFAGSEADLAWVPVAHQEVPVIFKPYVGEAVAGLLKEVLLPHLIRAVLTRLV